ncbi:hypothetical protein TPHA_0A04990 [Tetrapisispora phaffii CBS 4417]|uniref:Large ribosomal subunit protein uL6m n=1 Tax=Tetrapisispora phaffii (strain ATCC 24235 / CBS 4417 / NBRC 1672 / NRRL Y-8282 / UCD 70-5) TaxID=1071381 RepID=G8BNU6_TETPH|nr:mitochondrial 54S ribosomal protein YmL16 TPHA_0A04990 [Tetrapisispora phaffii CBS 4417]CCE61574.1 hypothetical protein TPHA_0A04990 [Tetrapisispora phaffii CBS 4417]
MTMSLISKRAFSCSSILRSYIGSAPIFLTEGTDVDIKRMDLPKVITKGTRVLTLSQLVTVKGPKGSITMEVPDFVSIQKDVQNNLLKVAVTDSTNKLQKSMWGTTRSHLNNHVIGVNDNHLAILRFVGTGYRASLEKKENNGIFVNVKVGASITQGLDVPEGITVSSPSPTSLTIEGCNKQQVLLFAAKIRNFHPPEPYKGKGIYVNDETIKIKDKKIK